jgi:hypothetical protein
LCKAFIIMRFLAVILFTLLIPGRTLNGQTGEETGHVPGVLSLRIKNINFFKNNEYFNPIKSSDFILISSLPEPVDKSKWIEGYTLPGFFIQPELVYQPSGKVTIRAGTHILKYSGTDSFTLIKPVFSTSLNISEKTILTVGTLSGCDKHLLFDPDFDSERLYTNYSEDGFQLTSSNDHLFTDTWVNWENFIFKGDTTREILSGGESFKFTSSAVAEIVHFIVPVQVQFKHYGGQTSNYLEPVETFYNFATGVRINIDLGKKRLSQAGIEYLQFFNTVVSNTTSSQIKNGNASWLRLHYAYKGLYIGAAYWKGHNFYAPEGNAIYASIYDFHSDYVIPERRIITNYISLNLLPESYLELFLGLQTYYDICTKKMDSSITLHLNFDKLIKLGTIRN